ncbi:MAG: hypothetical protein R3219_01580 [Hydrogenovibrio sp.]|nr:hypothetical protein [Hydrogenovibrio sp.]
MSKITILILLVVFGSLAIAFDWFNSRDYVDRFLSSAQEANQTIQQTGDEVSEVAEKVKEMKKAAE